MGTRTGVMVVGVRGATGSTMVAAGLALDPSTPRFLLSETGAARGMGLPALDELVFGGWDVRKETWSETLARNGVLTPARLGNAMPRLEETLVFDAAALPQDHAVVTGECAAAAPGKALLAKLRADIRAFRDRTAVERVVLLYVAGPAKLPPRESWPADADAFLAALEQGRLESAAPYYAAAAILEGAAVVDYTASPTLEIPGLVDLARREGVPLAGRDGSTGQTLLKSVLAETFATRRLPVVGWYSTNILGNHDGLVLQDDRYCDVKKIDKTELLDQILGYPVPSHVVDIRFYGPAGDDKEAWDAIDFETLLGVRGRMRINWQASDSLLATPPLLDLARFSSWAIGAGRAGIQEWMGVFFKYPLGTSERRYLRLAAALERFCAAHPGA